MYMSRDAGPSGLFATSGLADVDLTNNALGTIKTRYAAMDYFTTFGKRLGAMHLDKEIDSGNPNVKIVRFVDGAKSGYVLWCPTTAGTTAAGFALDLGGAKTATQVVLAKGAANGNESALTVSGGKASVDVSENPVIVLAD
jgi:hypothetical protein